MNSVIRYLFLLCCWFETIVWVLQHYTCFPLRVGAPSNAQRQITNRPQKMMDISSDEDCLPKAFSTPALIRRDYAQSQMEMRAQHSRYRWVPPSGEANRRQTARTVAPLLRSQTIIAPASAATSSVSAVRLESHSQPGSPICLDKTTNPLDNTANDAMLLHTATAQADAPADTAAATTGPQCHPLIPRHHS